MPFSASAASSHPLFFPMRRQIADTPLFHLFYDRTHRLAQITQRISHLRGHFRINLAGNESILLHRTQTVCQHFMADPFQILWQFIKPPWSGKQISDNLQFPLASYKLYCCCYRAVRQFLSFLHNPAPYHIRLFYPLYRYSFFFSSRLHPVPISASRHAIPPQILLQGCLVIKKCVLVCRKNIYTIKDTENISRISQNRGPPRLYLYRGPLCTGRRL